MFESTVAMEFDRWWNSLASRTQVALGKKNALKAFTAGHRAALNPQPKTYRFRSGRWVVSVKAMSMEYAIAEAERKLDDRAAKLAARRP